jgi:uncharacterized metal-binding protein (TIGR02443 family)
MPRRFIAGAVCPRCALQDKLVVDTDVGLRECVSCGFTDERPQEAPAEPRTRVTRPAARRQDTPAQVITLVPPPAAESDPGNAPEDPEDQGDNG